MPVVVLCLVQFVDVLGVTVTTTALPAMLDDLGAPRSAATPVATGYAMCFGGLLLLGARLGDRYGHRRVLLAGLLGFGLSSAVVAAAPSVVVLVAGRCGQGAAAALSVPAALRLLRVATGGDERRHHRALAAWSAAGAVAGGSGFVLGGVVTDLAGWRPLFWADVPLAAALVVAVLATVPDAPRTDAGERLALGSALLLTLGVMGVVLGAAGPQLPVLVAGALLVAAFAVRERQSRRPLVPPEGWRHPRLLAGAAGSFLNTAATSSTLTLAALELGGGRDAGLGLLPFSAAVVAGAALAPRIAGAAAAGLTLIALGAAAMLVLPVPVAAAVEGIGLGLASVGATAVGTAVPGGLQGAAAGVLNTAAQLGTALGVAGLLLVAEADVDAAYAVAALLTLAGAGALGLATRPAGPASLPARP